MRDTQGRPSRGRPYVAATLGLLVLLAGLVACTGGGTSGSTGAKTFSVFVAEPSHLIPGNDQEGNGILVISGLFDGLVQLKSDGKLENVAARSVTSSDQRTWTIRLQPGRTFHDGEKVTAKSFVNAWNAAAYGPNGWVNNYFFANIEGYDALNPAKGTPKRKTLSGLTVVDDLTFRVKLTAPFSQFPLTLAYTGFDPLPSVAFQGSTNQVSKAFDQHPVGNGPFRMVGSWKHNESITLSRYKGYQGPNRPQSDGVRFRIYSNPESGYNDLVAGSLDIDDAIPADRLNDARKLLNDRYLTAPSSTLHYLGFPLYDKRFRDVDVRRAFSMAIDRAAIDKAIYSNSYQLADSYVSPIVPGHRKGACGESCTFDPAAAHKLLAKAGGWHGKLTLWYSDGEGDANEMTAIANQLRQNLRITDITVKKQTFAQYLEALRLHKVDGPYRLDWGMDYPSPQNYLEPLYSTHGSSNRTGYTNATVDRDIDTGNRASSIDAGITSYNQAEDAVVKDLPTAPLFFGQIQCGWSDHVTNVHDDALVGIHLADVRVR